MPLWYCKCIIKYKSMVYSMAKRLHRNTGMDIYYFVYFSHITYKKIEYTILTMFLYLKDLSDLLGC